MIKEAEPNRGIALYEKPREISESLFISDYIDYIVEVYSIFGITKVIIIT